MAGNAHGAKPQDGSDSHGAKLPPWRLCHCGARYRAWNESGCREHRGSPGAAELARKQREARRQETIDNLAPRTPVPYNEFPPGY
jgi:hypothetical protein